MGLYSNTRVSALNEYASEEFRRSANVQSLIEACIEIRENDYKMFESLLNLDFVEASLLQEDYYDDLAKQRREENAKNDKDTAAANTAAAEDRKKATAEGVRKANEIAKKNAGNRSVAPTEDETTSIEDSNDKKIEGNHYIFGDGGVEKATESKIKKIWEKIVAFFQNIIDKIKAFFAKVIAKLREVLGRDKAIVEKYKNAFTSEKMSGFEGVSDISVPTKTPDEMQKYAENHVVKMKDNLATLLGKIEAAKSKDVIDGIKYDDEVDEDEFIFLSNEGINNVFFKKYEGDSKFVPTPDFMKVALESISARSKVLAAMEKTAKDFEKNLTEQKNKFKAKEKELKGKDELALAKAAGSFKLVQNYSAATTKIANAFVNTATKAFGVYRKLVLIVGKYALKDKKDKKTAKNESAMDFAIAEASDLYIAEAIGF